MGGLVSYLYAGRVGAEYVNDPSWDIPDTNNKLTRRQKAVVRETWEPVKKDLRAAGVCVLLELIRVYPSYQKHFKSFADIPFDQLSENKKFQAHALNVVYAITALVDNLDDTECLQEMLLKMGENHGRHSITVQQFDNLAVIIIETLARGLGDKFTPFVRAAWVQVLEIISTVVARKLNPPETSQS